MTVRIDELITSLQYARDRYGNLQVVLENGEDPTAVMGEAEPKGGSRLLVLIPPPRPFSTESGPVERVHSRLWRGRRSVFTVVDDQ